MQYYHSPELLLKHDSYSLAIDILSFGCVFAEIVLKQAPFRVDGEIELFNSWCSQLGDLTIEDQPINIFNLIEFTASEKTSNNAITLLESTVNPHCFNLITKIFVCDPLKRTSAREALRHDFFANVNNENMEEDFMIDQFDIGAAEDDIGAAEDDIGTA